MRLVSGSHFAKPGNILLHGHHAGARKFLDQCVAFHVIAVGVTAEDNLDVGELEAQLLDGSADRGDSGFEIAIDQDVALGSSDEEGSKLLGADVVDVADHFVWREGSVIVPFCLLGLSRQLQRCEEEDERQAHGEGSVSESGDNWSSHEITRSLGTSGCRGTVFGARGLCNSRGAGQSNPEAGRASEADDGYAGYRRVASDFARRKVSSVCSRKTNLGRECRGDPQ